MAAVLTRGLTTVRTEFNTVFLGRDKASDGWIADQAHTTSISGHNPDITGKAEHKDGDSKNEVRAIDVDTDLVPGSGVDHMELVVQYLVKRARAGHYIPFRYIIYKGRIWSRSDGWQTHTYTGANKHDKHAHLSGDYTQAADEWTGSLGLENIPVALTSEDKTWISNEIGKQVREELPGILKLKTGHSVYPNRTLEQFVNDAWAKRDHEVGDTVGAASNPLSPSSPLGRLLAAALLVPGIDSKVGGVGSGLNSAHAKLDTISGATDAAHVKLDEIKAAVIEPPEES